MDKNYLEPFIFGEISQEFNFCIGESETNIYSVGDKYLSYHGFEKNVSVPENNKFNKNNQR